MSKQEEIIEVCGKEVVVRYTPRGYSPCNLCVFHHTGHCLDAQCNKYDNDGNRAHFAKPVQPQPEETHSLREWAQILAANPDLRAEFDKMCPPQPIQGSIAPEADLEEEFERFLDDVEGVPRMYHPEEQIEWAKDIARHFAEWERARIESKLRLAWGKISMNPFDVDSVFRELLEHLKK